MKILNQIFWFAFFRGLVQGRYQVIFAVILVVLCGLSLQAKAADIVGLHVTSTDATTTVTLNAEYAVAYKKFVLQNPDRLVLDFKDAAWNVESELIVDSGVIDNIRHGARNGGADLRLVLDLKQPLSSYHVTTIEAGEGSIYFRIIIDLSYNKVTAVQPAIEKVAVPTNKMAEAPVVAPTSMVGSVLAPVPLPERKPLKGGKRKPIIVIDAGHGGHDPGAIGYSGTKEKYVTLGYARALKDALQRTGQYDVKLVREDDYFVTLRGRVKKAQENKADLFISLHADSHNDSRTRGLSVYTLSEKASDKEAAALAAHANTMPVLEGMDLAEENDEIADILIDLVQRGTKNMSSNFAEGVAEELGKEVRLLRNAHRFAGFRVLTAPDIPSALIELGYLSNKKEEYLLNTPAYKEKIVNALVRSINDFFEDRELIE